MLSCFASIGKSSIVARPTTFNKSVCRAWKLVRGKTPSEARARGTEKVAIASAISGASTAVVLEPKMSRCSAYIALSKRKKTLYINTGIKT